MSHPVNDEILENLYEESLNELTILHYPKLSEEKIEKMAENLAQKRFEDLSQWQLTSLKNHVF